MGSLQNISHEREEAVKGLVAGAKLVLRPHGLSRLLQGEQHPGLNPFPLNYFSQVSKMRDTGMSGLHRQGNLFGLPSASSGKCTWP